MMVHVYGTQNLNWQDDWLCLSQRKIVRIVPDAKYPGIMWRVERPDGSTTDMVNRTRAKDAAYSIALGILNSEETGRGASPVR